MRKSVVWWWCVAAAWWAGGCGAAESFLNSIGRNLHAEMAGVLEAAAVNYSQPLINGTYVASVQFDMRAMGMLYNATPIVIDAIAHKQAYPPGIVSVSDGHIELPAGGLRAHWRPLLAHYAGPTAVLVVALLLVAALPLAGLLWCCCYWCRGGRRRRPFDRKYDACLKGLLAILLIGLLTLFLFGVVCAFATDSQVEEGVAESPAAVRAGLRDINTFLNDTNAHARWILVDNYAELERKLNGMLESSGVTISVQLGEFSRAVSVTTLANMVRQLDSVREDLRTVQTLTASLRTRAETLNAALRNVKKQLLETLARCSQPQCVQLQEKHKIGQLDTEIHYSQMPDVSSLLRNVSAVVESDIAAEVLEGEAAFRNLQRNIRNALDTHIPDVQEAIANGGRRLRALSDQLTSLTGNATVKVNEQAEVASALQHLHRQYGPYRRYIGIATATSLLVIVVVLSWGLVCGVCGKRPDVYGASDCCNKGTGSRCLLCGTALLFIIGGCVSLVLAMYFVFGVAAQRFICDPLTEPRDNRVFMDLERVVDLERAVFNERTEEGFNMTHVLLLCHRNYTIYQTLQLHRFHDVEALRKKMSEEVSGRITALGQAFRAQAHQRPVTILRMAARVKLTTLAKSGLSDFNFDKILDALDTNITSLRLDELGGQLERAGNSLAARPGFAEVAYNLKEAAARLHAHQTDILEPMLHDIDKLNRTALQLRDGLRFNHSSLREAISYLMHETAQAEAFLNSQGPDLVQNMTRQFAQAVAKLLEEYMDRVVYATNHDIGRCGPVSRAFNATRDAHCRKILMPVNGYWLSLAWCLAVVVPLMAVSVRLARLYLHLDPYPGPLVEAEYLYDAYADRDNVPLANAYKAEKRVGRSGRRGPSREEPPPPVDTHHARRYNDMAPKHWEEGPPRYHGPTEYERPPPYYYPGPNDRQ